MDLGSIVLTLIVVGVVLWLINSFIPMDGKIKTLLNIVVVVFVVVWLLQSLGGLRGSDRTYWGWGSRTSSCLIFCK